MILFISRTANSIHENIFLVVHVLLRSINFQECVPCYRYSVTSIRYCIMNES